MLKRLKYTLLIALIFIVGCTDAQDTQITDYDDDEIVAMVNDDDITIKDLRMLYPDDKALDMIDGTVKAILVMQEAKDLNIDLSEEIDQNIEAMVNHLPQENSDPMWQSIHQFNEAQAQKFGMEPDEFHKEYVEITAKQNAYINAYVQEMLGVPDISEEALEAYDLAANDLLDNLVKENQAEIEILIKP